MRVAVIGGGVIGLLCAHHLRKRGAEVVILERDRVGGGCSSGNAGWITPSIAMPLPAPGLRLRSIAWMFRRESPLHIRPAAAPAMAGWLLRFWRHCNRDDFDRGSRAFASLGAQTMALFDELSADGAVFESRAEGLLMVFRRRQDLDRELALLKRFGYGPVSEVGPGELHDLEPALAPEISFGAHVLPERVVRPESLCAGVAAALRRARVAIREHAQVSALVMERGRARAASIVDGDPIEADAFLIATGAEAAALAPAGGVRLPLQAGKGYSVTVDSPRVQLRRPLYLGDAIVGVTPFDGSLRVAGTMELSGINRRLDRRRLEALMRAAAREVPGALEGSARREWVGMRPLTPDGLPILGALPATANVYVATGHQMLGVTLAPSTGKAMAQLILEGRSEVDLGPFAAERFLPRRLLGSGSRGAGAKTGETVRGESGSKRADRAG